MIHARSRLHEEDINVTQPPEVNYPHIYLRAEKPKQEIYEEQRAAWRRDHPPVSVVK